MPMSVTLACQILIKWPYFGWTLTIFLFALWPMGDFEQLQLALLGFISGWNVKLLNRLWITTTWCQVILTVYTTITLATVASVRCRLHAEFFTYDYTKIRTYWEVVIQHEHLIGLIFYTMKWVFNENKVKLKETEIEIIIFILLYNTIEESQETRNDNKNVNWPKWYKLCNY